MITKGSIWLADLNRVYKETENTQRQKGLRPVIIISNDKFNEYSPVVQVIPLSTRITKQSPVHVEVGINCGVKKPSIALVEQKTTIDKTDLVEKIGDCDMETLVKINRAIIFQENLIEPFNWKRCLKLVLAIINAKTLLDGLGIGDTEPLLISTLNDELKSYCQIYGKNYKEVFALCKERLLKLNCKVAV